MKEISKNKLSQKSYSGQDGSTKVYALLAILVLFSLVHAGWNYLPVIYQSENYKGEMHNAIVQIMASPRGANEPMAEKIKKRLRILGNENGVPANANIEVTEANGGAKARVRFVREVNILPFGLYKYRYEFDNTAQ